MRNKIIGLKPIVDQDTKLLILGSIPGNSSLKNKEYYSCKNNHFWKIIFKTFSKKDPIDYKERINFLKLENIGIWNIIRSCQRQGSCDDKIIGPKLNNLGKLLYKYPNISRIFLNGRKAYDLFQSFFPNLNISNKYLPSTSSRNTKSYKYIIRKWEKYLKRS
ncbi:DNA-deoxyinosine glycosylase [Candidatus Desantisbacteria bacterium CG_4_10_14_0_8_um_filter_48_22]|uniref:DNA-deoxyinosine glycosylase n=1 Tax=Candidatus Desantisbacteria bacterium CG_4_10_14_0_8_um_filter_48_22 TaxID=1974543 RepID=A0A2M7S4Y7_9BACT|nr:MAG: DNA-deoxyinosine glycosylase [Candidatus Desantisbacteria bacterium CG1_02_49_89]PIZ14594.1 MAG: DNA-deoxyinosine glycosylase [Candidatus Desantisbacteria bacterium CG_4_10_14_0_8_um_filter_48_22]